MRIIDAHAHVGSFGSWARVSCTPADLVREMGRFGVSKAILFALDNELTRKAVLFYPKRYIGYVWYLITK